MKLLFVCSGNTCRSPLAEAIARKVAQDRGLKDVTVASAGTGAWGGMPPSDGSLLVAMERGMELGNHKSQPLTKKLIDESDLVLAMGHSHLRTIKELGGKDSEAKAYLLDTYASRGATNDQIDDPFGLDLNSYRHMADNLESRINAVFDRIMEHSDK